MIKLSKHNNDVKLDIGFKSLLNKHESPTILFGWRGESLFQKDFKRPWEWDLLSEEREWDVFKKKDLDLYTTLVNSTFRLRWLASSEVVS